MNPMQIISQIMGNNQMMNNPIISNAVSMYRKNDVNGLQNLATNLAKERGMDIEQLKNNVLSNFK